MKKITTVEEGICALFAVRSCEVPSFSYKRKSPGEYVDTLLFDEKAVPIFDDCFNAHYLYMAQYGAETEKNSALNVYSFTGSDVSLSELMFREMFIAEYILHAQIVSVTAVLQPNAANLILGMADGTAANLDLGNTMAPGSVNQCQHRLITTKGAACDRGAGSYTVEGQVQVFSEQSLAPIGYNDDLVYLYGLGERDVQKACTAHALLSGQLDHADWSCRKARYSEAVDAASVSDAERRTVELKGACHEND